MLVCQLGWYGSVMSTNYQDKKVKRKQVRCRALVSKDINIPSVDSPTPFIGICNAGLSTGLTDEGVLQKASQFGQVSRLVMVPNKSYCFLGFDSAKEAIKVFHGMHGKSTLGQNGSIIYMAFFENIPQSEDPISKELPPGAFILKDFVSEDEEASLLGSIDQLPSGALKNRSVKHFGYEFLYGSNLVDPRKPLKDGIPNECTFLWRRLRERHPSLDWYEPDQLTVNQYMPGHGIPPHVDTHSPFADPILSLSLQSDVVMDFRKGDRRISVLLPRRSLLIMSGESRYGWTHGITPRAMDIVQTPKNTFTTQQRSKRTSFTFRKLRSGPCECSFPDLCDSHRNSSERKETLEQIAKKLEESNVHCIYDKIANHFSETRHSPWPNVAKFVQSFPEGSVIVDIGCGNGKYLSTNQSTFQIGCDRSVGLLNVCDSNKQNVFKCDCLSVPVRSSSADGVISIAVIHHLASESRRLQSIKEMSRILRPLGFGLIYVWAKDQKANADKSSYLRQNKAVIKGKTTESDQRRKAQAETQNIELNVNVKLPIHTNRTQFLEQDVLVPWKLKSEQGCGEKTTFLRYYHVFEANELESLCQQVPDIKIEKSFYDQGNHCVVFSKI